MHAEYNLEYPGRYIVVDFDLIPWFDLCYGTTEKETRVHNFGKLTRSHIGAVSTPQS